MKRFCSDNDVIVRFGGDEFIIFSNVKNLIHSNNEYSCGCYEKDMNNLSECINRASLKMFENKEEVINSILSYTNDFNIGVDNVSLENKLKSTWSRKKNIRNVKKEVWWNWCEKNIGFYL